MPNLLKNIFSHDEVKYQGTLKFKNRDAQEQFCEALETAYNEGRVVNVDGVEAINTNIKSNDSYFPVDAHEHISKFMVGPASEYITITARIDGEERALTLIRKFLKGRIVLETLPDSVVSLSLSFLEEDIHKVTVSFAEHYEQAKTVKEVSEGLKIATAILSLLFDPDKKSPSDDEAISLPDVINHFRSTSVLFERLSAIERELEISIPPTELHSITDAIISDINELFVLICLKKTIRTDYKLTSTDNAHVPPNVENEERLIGSELFLTLHGTVEYELFNNRISLHTVGVAINVIVKEIIHGKDSVRFVYGDTDTKPMYISIKAFKTDDEASAEAEKVLEHKEDYITAKTCKEYLNEEE